jgi:hypothetical protein
LASDDAIEAHPQHEEILELMRNVPDLQERQITAAAAKKAMLEKFRAALNDPGAEARRAERMAMHEARLLRTAEREAARKAHQAELDKQAAHAAELALKAQREAEAEAEKLRAIAEAEKAEREAALKAEQKQARDARYAARKAAQKRRRKGL